MEKDNKYKKVEGLLKLYPEIPMRIRNAERFLQLGEECRISEIKELKLKQAIVNDMMEYLKDRNEIGYNVVALSCFKRKTAAAIAMQLNISEHHVYKIKRNMITQHLMSFVK